jgi:hypothetical protein
MQDFQQYPMALYHPVTGKFHVVADEKEHQGLLAKWASEKPPEPVKNKGGRPRKNP